MALTSLRLDDVQTFLTAVRVGAINGAARVIGVTPSQVSKAIVRLERYVGVELVLRGPRGVLLSEDGKRVAPQLTRLIELTDAIGAQPERSDLTIIGTSYLNDFFLPVIVGAVPDVHVHSLQAAPTLPSAFAGQPVFDVALVVGRERWPATFSALEIGRVRKALFGSRSTAARLGGRTTVEHLREELFVGAIYSDGAQVQAGDDGCPLSARARRFGDRTQTAALAFALACTTDQVVFGPELAARRYVERGELVEISVKGWNVQEPLYLICHQERVAARTQRALANAMKQALRRS